MTTIKEGEVLETEPDLTRLFDFGESDALETASVTQAIDTCDLSKFVCPSHPNAESCLCHEFMGDWDVPIDLQASSTDVPMVDAEQLGDFGDWIPRYSKPLVPCDYCNSRQLECFVFMTQEGQTTCSPCNALFRECSFTREAQGVQRPQEGAIDTLHVVNEDVAQELGALTGIKALKSLQNPTVDSNAEEIEKSRKTGNRFPKAAVKTLRDWLEINSRHPYPTEEEKENLKKRTGLSGAQISNWLANARRRGKVRPKRAASPSLSSSSQPIKIPQNIDRTTWENLNPLERWKHSPPENEPATVDDIAYAVSSKKYDPIFINSTQASFEDSKPNSKQNSSGSSHSAFRAPSITSHRTTKSSGPSLSDSAWSGSRSRTSFGSFGSFNSGAKKERQRRRKVMQPPPT
ncbi:MAG: hypothetical protein M1822_005973 [Bathelium mastoideum]|nr:MAG: hypothetical protein M1822_005973 [Bathelium mastoideum]